MLCFYEHRGISKGKPFAVVFILQGQVDPLQMVGSPSLVYWNKELQLAAKLQHTSSQVATHYAILFHDNNFQCLPLHC